MTIRHAQRTELRFELFETELNSTELKTQIIDLIFINYNLLIVKCLVLWKDLINAKTKRNKGIMFKVIWLLADF